VGRVKLRPSASSPAVAVVDEVPWSRIRAYQLPMGVRGVVPNAGVARLRPVLLCTKLADLSHEQCTGQTRRESSACSATGHNVLNYNFLGNPQLRSQMLKP